MSFKNLTAGAVVSQSDDLENPWWLADFKDVYPLWSLELRRPRRGGEWTLAVEISRDGRNWETLHQEKADWTGRLILTYNGEIIARCLRLTLTGGGLPPIRRKPVLGLFGGVNSVGMSQVKVFTRRHKLTVVHRRDDGMGGRLISLLHAMYLAKVLNCKMRFAWRELPRPEFVQNGSRILGAEVGRVKEVFDPGFIKRHYLPKMKLTYAARVDQAGSGLSARDFLNPENHDSKNLLHVGGADLSGLLNPKLAPDAAFNLWNIFQELPLSRPLRAMVEAAEAADLPEKFSALHIRSGDLVYDAPHRLNPGKTIILPFSDFNFIFTTKSLPLPLARMLIERLSDDGYKVIIFSEDLKIVDLLTSAYGVKAALDYWPRADLSLMQKQIFDLTLMARANLICAPGHSSFSILAARLGREVKSVNAHQRFDRDEVLSFFARDLKANQNVYPAPHLAHSYGYMYYIGRGIRDVDELTGWLGLADSFAPGRGTYQYARAVEYYKAGRTAEAEKILTCFFKFRLEANGGFSYDQNSNVLSPAALTKQEDYFREVMAAAAEQGSPAAAMFMSLVESAFKRPEKAAAWEQKARLNSGGPAHRGA